MMAGREETIVKVPESNWNLMWTSLIDLGALCKRLSFKKSFKEKYSEKTPWPCIIKCPKCGEGIVDEHQNLFECKNGNCGCKFTLTFQNIKYSKLSGERNRCEEQSKNEIKQKDISLVRVLDGFWKYVWNEPSSYDDWNNFKTKFKQCPNAYIIICPHCQRGSVKKLKQDSLTFFQCEECKCKFTATIKEIFDRKPQNEPSNMTLAIGIGSPTEDWYQIQEGTSLASFLNQLNKEDDLWFARVPEKYLFPSDGVEERHLLLLIIDGIKTTQEGDDVFRSRLAIRKLLRDNGDAVLRQIVWITDEQLKISNLELRRP